jgi:hypothetical protein
MMAKKFTGLLVVVFAAVISIGLHTEAQVCSKSRVPQGISCLHCMDSRVKHNTAALVQALGNSCIQEVAIAFVLDKSFGFDESIIRNAIDSLLANNKNVSLHLYFLNGSAIRKAGSRMFTGFLNSIPPDVFRERIKNDKTTQDQIKNFSARFVPLLRWANSKGVRLSLSPMLEDNLDNQSYNILLKILKSVVPTSFKVSWTRNPCPDCFPGNQSAVPKSVLREDHSGRLPLGPLSRIVSNDGWGYVAFQRDSLLNPRETLAQGRIQKSLYLRNMDEYRDASIRNGAVFLLWFSKYQGTLMARTQLPWQNRDLPNPSTSELSEITEFFNRSK